MADEDTVQADTRRDARTDRSDVRPDMPAAAPNGAPAGGEFRDDDAEPAGRTDVSGTENRFAGAGTLMQAIQLAETIKPRNAFEQQAADELREVGQKISELKAQGVSEQEIQQALGSLPANADPIMAAQEALAKLNELQKQEEKDAKDRAVQEQNEIEKKAEEAKEFYQDVSSAIGAAAVAAAAAAPTADTNERSRFNASIMQKLFSEEPGHLLNPLNFGSTLSAQNNQTIGGMGEGQRQSVVSLGSLALAAFAPTVVQNPSLAVLGTDTQHGVAAGKDISRQTQIG